jgi:methyl-accepting chemotaxis protein
VDSEVKSLATQTAKATDEISESIQAATARAAIEIRTIADVAARSREIATGIASAIGSRMLQPAKSLPPSRGPPRVRKLLPTT